MEPSSRNWMSSPALRMAPGALAFSPDSRFLFCGDGGGSVHIYDLEQKTVRHVKASDGRIYALAIAPSGKYFATGSYREEVRIWDLDGKLQGESRFDPKIIKPVGPAYSLAFTPEGDKLVAWAPERAANGVLFPKRPYQRCAETRVESKTD
jgi:WD40 repeat protein